MTDIKGQPDRWFKTTEVIPGQSKDIRLDTVGLSLAEEFLLAINDLESEGTSGFSGFGEDIFRHDYFRNFEEISVRLGLAERYREAFSQLEPTFALVSQLTSGSSSRFPNTTEIEMIAKSYRKFLGEIKDLFSEFQTSHAEI